MCIISRRSEGEMMSERPVQTGKCHNCGKEYNYYNSANMIIFCPHCHHCDCVSCDFGTVTPCYIDLGDKNVGTIVEEGNDYKLVSEVYGIDQVLKSRYMEAIGEAGNIISEKIDGN